MWNAKFPDMVCALGGSDNRSSPPVGRPQPVRQLMSTTLTPPFMVESRPLPS